MSPYLFFSNVSLKENKPVCANLSIKSDLKQKNIPYTYMLHKTSWNWNIYLCLILMGSMVRGKYANPWGHTFPVQCSHGYRHVDWIVDPADSQLATFGVLASGLGEGLGRREVGGKWPARWFNLMFWIPKPWRSLRSLNLGVRVMFLPSQKRSPAELPGGRSFLQYMDSLLKVRCPGGPFLATGIFEELPAPRRSADRIGLDLLVRSAARWRFFGGG